MESDNNNSTDDSTTYVITCVILSITLPLTLLAIYTLYSQIKKDHVTPIYIINLLISDFIQLIYMIIEVAEIEVKEIEEIFYYMYCFGVVTSVGFMVCIALERYLLIAWPLWYHFKRTMKVSLVVCVVVWILPLGYVIPYYLKAKFVVIKNISAVFLLIPFPLLIFFLVGTLKGLSAVITVPSDEKRRIVGMLVLVLLIYTVLFLPAIIMFLTLENRDNYNFSNPTLIILRFSPLADLILYFFLRKGVIDKLLASLCCCRMDKDDNARSSA